MFNKLYEKFKIFLKENYKFLIFLVFLVFALYYELPYIIYKSGGTIDLENRIVIDKEYKEEGTLSMSYVSAIKGTPAFILLSYILPDWDLIPLSDITNEDSYEDVLEVGKEYLNEGINNAIIAAFNESDYGINIKRVINTVAFLSDKAQTDVEVGDEILEIDGHNITSLDDVKEYINTLKENDEVKIKVLNKDQEYERYAKIYYEEETNDLKVGVSFKTSYDYETEIPVKIKMKSNESGSSGGLMMSLAIYNALTEEDITKGKNIVGTGSINSDGTVEEIGGVKYKVLGASKNKADVFLCPIENYQEALDIKNKRKLNIEIVGVSTLSDAIEYLKSME